MKISHRDEIVIETDDGLELTIPYSEICEDEVLIKKLDNGLTAFGCLIRDSYFECDRLDEDDGTGRIWDRRNRGKCPYEEEYSIASKKDMLVYLDIYSHSGDVFAVAGSEQARNFPDQRWDVSHNAGIWMPDKCLRDELKSFPKKKHREMLTKWAEEAVETLNNVLDGEVYGVVTMVFDDKGEQVGDESACWGYIGTDYARKELAASLNGCARTQTRRKCRNACDTDQQSPVACRRRAGHRVDLLVTG